MITTAVGPRLDPAVQRAVEQLKAHGGGPVYTLPLDAARAGLVELQSLPVSKPPANIADAVIPGGPTGSVAVRVVRPETVAAKLPAILYLHGGGFVLGDEHTHDRLIREIANGARAAVVFVKYARSPEARYPVALEQVYAVAGFLAGRGAEWNIDGSRLAVVGDSAGGNLAAAVSLLAVARGAPTFKYQVLFYPNTDATFDSASYREFADGPRNTRAAMKWFYDQYAPDASDRERPTVSPLRASRDQLARQPPALIITAENDVLRDEGEAYAHALMEAGVAVTAVRCLGTIHDFVMLNLLADTIEARNAIELANRHLKESLYAGVSNEAGPPPDQYVR
jgi:acetyl esterase